MVSENFAANGRMLGACPGMKCICTAIPIEATACQQAIMRGSFISRLRMGPPVSGVIDIS